MRSRQPPGGCRPPDARSEPAASAPPQARSGAAGPAPQPGSARAGSQPPLGAPPAYLPSNATGSGGSCPGSESMAAPERGSRRRPRLLCARLWRLRWNSNGRNRFRHLCVDGGEAAEATASRVRGGRNVS